MGIAQGLVLRPLWAGATVSIGDYAIYSIGIGICLAQAKSKLNNAFWTVYCYSSAAFILFRAIERIVQP